MHVPAGTAAIPHAPDDAIDYVIRMGGNANTKKAVQVGERSWAAWLISRDVKINTSRTNHLMALPVCTVDQAASIVAAYYAALAKTGKKFSTIQNYGWAARALIARHGGPAPDSHKLHAPPSIHDTGAAAQGWGAVTARRRRV